MQFRYDSRNRQRGAALIFSLIFLVLMTLLSTSSMRTSTMQERMSGNMRDWNLGFQGAEAALREAENYLLSSNNLPPFNNANGFYQVNSPDRPVWVGDEISDGNGYINYTGQIPGTSRAPRYYFEKLSSIRPPGTSTETGTAIEEYYYYRVTAAGYGGAYEGDGNPLTAVVLSSVYRSR